MSRTNLKRLDFIIAQRHDGVPDPVIAEQVEARRRHGRKMYQRGKESREIAALKLQASQHLHNVRIRIKQLPARHLVARIKDNSPYKDIKNISIIVKSSNYYLQDVKDKIAFQLKLSPEEVEEWVLANQVIIINARMPIEQLLASIEKQLAAMYQYHFPTV